MSKLEIVLIDLCLAISAVVMGTGLVILLTQ